MTRKKETLIIVCVPNTKRPWRVCHSELGYEYFVASKHAYASYEDAERAVARIKQFNEEMAQTVRQPEKKKQTVTEVLVEAEEGKKEG